MAAAPLDNSFASDGPQTGVLAQSLSFGLFVTSGSLPDRKRKS
jgi:hypothetical protein